MIISAFLLRYSNPGKAAGFFYFHGNRQQGIHLELINEED